MRRRRRTSTGYLLDRRWLIGAVGLVAFLIATVNCTLDDSTAATLIADREGKTVEVAAANEETQTLQNESQPLAEAPAFLSSELWADVSDVITTPRPSPAPSSPTTISLDVRDANLLDVLSLLAYKLDANVIFIEEPTQVTFKTENLSVVTTFQLLLQKEGLDYLTVGRNYIVGNRDRLYDDFTNRMLVSRYQLFYVAASDMENYITELGMPVQSLTIDSNQKAIWMQGTPMTLGKARELINTLDVMENAAFAEGGARKIRMPVATATGPRAEEELEALIDLLSILLDGFRDGRTDMGWVTWDHPDPIPYIYMDWESPIIKPYDIMMKITRNFTGDYENQIRYLIAEGTPDNINLVNQMISAIAGTPNSPLTFGSDSENGDNGDTVQWIPDTQQQQTVYTPSHAVTVSAVPTEGGKLTGSGSYSQGSNVTVTAAPADGYEFVRWIENGAELSTNRSYSFSIYMDRKIEAVFITGTQEGSGDNAPQNDGE